MWRHQKTRSVCVKQALNTRRWLVNALVTWHVSYKITTLVRILFSFLSKEALSFDSKWFLSITFNSKIFLFFCVCFFSFFNFEFFPCIDESRIHYDVYLCWNHQLDLWNATRNANCYVNSSHLTLATQWNENISETVFKIVLHLLKMFWLSERTIFLQFLFANWKIHNPFFSSTIYK